MRKSYNLENAKRIRLEDDEKRLIKVLKNSFSDEDWDKGFQQYVFDKIQHLYCWDEEEGLTPRIKSIIDGWIVDLFFKLCSYNLINTYDMKSYIKDEYGFINKIYKIEDTFGRESLIRMMFEAIKAMQIGFAQGDGTYFRLIEREEETD